MTKRLENHKSAQCHVIIDGCNIHFISYVTRVISIIMNPETGGAHG